MREWLPLYYLGCEHKMFVALFLDAQLRPLRAQEMFQGTLHQIDAHPREVVKEALRQNATAGCVAYDNVSREAASSADDRSMAVMPEAGLQLVDVRLVDHFLVVGGKIMSPAEKSWM